MLVANASAELTYRLDDNISRRGRGSGGRQEIGRQRVVGAVVQVAADAVARGELPLEVVLPPAKPARLDVAGNAPAIAEKSLADETTVSDLEIAAHQPEIDMPPRLRPVGGKGNVGRRVLGQVAGQRAGGGRHHAPVGDTADGSRLRTRDYAGAGRRG